MRSRISRAMKMIVSSALLAIVLFSKLNAADPTEAFLGAKKVSASTNDLHSTRHKRAPGWGKRSSELPDVGLYDNSGDLTQSADNLDVLKRAPGWGKRADDFLSDIYEKRAPGWGKRSDELDFNEEMIDKKAPGWGKRAPGWGKRAPGWGKRAPGWGKRAPGWGKRAPGWGKRAPGWGKRSVGLEKKSPAYCEAMDELVDELIMKAVEANGKRLSECGLRPYSK